MTTHPSLNRSPGRLRASAMLAVIVLSVTACKREKPANDSAVAADTTAGASVRSSFTAMNQGPPAGVLAKDISAYSGEEFRALVDGLPWGDSVNRPRRCTGDPGCSGSHPSARTSASIAAVRGQDSIGPVGLPANGVVGARIDNTGNLREESLGLQPGARFRYYLVVYSDTGTVGKWKLEELERTGTTYAHRTVRQGRFIGCNHPWQAGARADFKTCAQAAAGITQQAQLIDPTNPPPWLSCSSGCCTADQ